jgi:DNA-directed RNA polymerase specialized sigma24 family protein
MKENESRGVGSANTIREDLERQFSSCRGLLRQVAERVLSGEDDVEEAIERCYAATAGERRRFRSEGEFRRWLVRTVLNQALMILHEKESAEEGSSELIFWQIC